MSWFASVDVVPLSNSQIWPAPKANTITVMWNESNMTSIHITPDGADITSQFTFDYANQKATASIVFPATIQHTLAVNGQYYFISTINVSNSATYICCIIQ